MSRLMSNIGERVHEILLIVMVTCYSIAFSALFILRYHLFQLHADTGTYEQVVWNTLHGHFIESSLAISNIPVDIVKSGGPLPDKILAPFPFSELHTNLVVLLFAPFYAIFPHTETLLVTNSIILSIGAIPVYFLAKTELRNKTISLIISASYLLFPGLQAANVIDFNYLVFAVPFLLSAFYFYKQEKWKLYWFFIGLSLTVREEVSVFVLFLGIYMFLFNKQRKIGLITIIVGIIFFVIAMIILNSLPTHLFIGNFAIVSKGNGIFGIPHVLLTDPAVIYNHVMRQTDAIYIFEIFSHTAFLSLLSPTVFMMSLPDLIKNLLGDPEAFRLMWGHYQLLLIPGVFISTIFSIKKIITKYKEKRKAMLYFLGILILVSSIASNSFFSLAPMKSLGLELTDNGIKWEKRFVWWEFSNLKCCSKYDYKNNPLYSVYKDQIDSVNKAILMIPDNSSVASQDDFLPHLSKRSELYFFPIYYDKVDYVLVNEKNVAPFGTGFIPQNIQDKYVSILKNDKKHELIFNENGILLFKKIK